ncbi:MAG: type II toxin-antitoxin system VapC family toxin [Actinomycetaceae bacterium]|nr:type II toxin-antitoxin system VapC family toxin [Actinomycetaceae bacterium]
MRIGVDANVLVRMISVDDMDQALKAREFGQSLRGDRYGFFSKTALVEAFWVLTRAHKLPKTQVLHVYKDLLDLSNVLVEDSGDVMWAIGKALEEKADFPDALISAAARSANCHTTVTFDKKAAKAFGWQYLGDPATTAPIS